MPALCGPYRLSLVFAFSFLFCPLGCGLSIVAAEVRSNVIGIITDLSGPAAAIGEKVRIGAEIAADEIRQSGGEIRLVFGDSGFNPQKALSEAQKLIAVDKVDAIFVNFTPTSVAVFPVCKTQKVLLLYTAAAESPTKGYDYSFKSNLDYRALCKKVAEYWLSQGLTKVGFLKPEAEYGELCLQGVRHTNIEIVEQSYKLGDSQDVQVLLLKNKGVKAILNPAYERDLLNMFKAFHKYQLKVPVASDMGSFTMQLIDEYRGYMEGTVAFGLPDLSSDLHAEALNRDREHSDVYMEHVGMGYLHVKQLWNAIKKCPVRDLECQSKILSESPADSKTGFERWNHRLAEYRDNIKVFDEGKWKELR